jgi:threonine/homoserine/homoserine lactone efflux protein
LLDFGNSANNDAIAEAKMNYSENLWLFFALVFGIIIVPGMDMMIVLSHSLSRKAGAGYAAVVGIVTAGALHSVYAGLGVGIVLTLFPKTYAALLIIGAAYVAWIGWQLARSQNALGQVGENKDASLKRAFRDGVVTAMTNPKAYLFMLAVYPQFLKADYGPLFPQAVIMALIIAVTQFAVYAPVAFGASAARGWLERNPGAQMMTTRIVGWVMIAVAMLTLYQGWRSSG